MDKLFPQPDFSSLVKNNCNHAWLQYSDSDRYYCTKCLAQVVLEIDFKFNKLRVKQYVELGD